MVQSTSRGPHKYSCREGCDKTFFHRSHRDSHELTHTGERPYQCDVCGSTFSRKDKLNDHQRRLHGDAPFQCPTCDEKFPNLRLLQVHHKRTHGCSVPMPGPSSPKEKSMLICETCAKSFPTRYKLERHLAVHDEFVCTIGECKDKPLSERTFIGANTFNKHKAQAHPPVCPYPVCEGRKFSSARRLAEHISRHEYYEALHIPVTYDILARRRLHRGRVAGDDNA